MHYWVDSEQRPRVTIEIEADSLGHDLTYGWSHFLRGSHPNGRASVTRVNRPGRAPASRSRDDGAARSQEHSSEGDGLSHYARLSLRKVGGTSSMRETRARRAGHGR